MVTSSYAVKVKEPDNRDLLEKIEQLTSELRASRMETARVEGKLAATAEQLKRASQRAGELQAKVYLLEGELGDQKDAIDELSFNARQDLGVRGRA